LVRGHGLRRARYRGKARLDLQIQFIGAACNIKRWLSVLAWETKMALRAAAGLVGELVTALKAGILALKATFRGEIPLLAGAK
jgi:hypothetical protein